MLLKEKIAFYKVCFDSMQAGILVYNEKEEIVLANTPISQIFDYTQSDLEKIKVYNLFKDFKIFKNFIKTPDAKKYKKLIEITGIKKNGNEFPAELSFGKISYENKPYFKLLLTDISLRKKKEWKIESLNTQLEEEVKIRNIELENVIEKLKISLRRELCNS